MFKRSLCIFLSVMMLFLCVNNSYFSPHKMDKVEATGAVIAGGAAITAEVIIELIAAIGVTALGSAIIDDVIDWDWNAICNDVHDWCRDNVDVLEQYVTDGTSALKEWALADEWVVIEGGGGSPDPSPSSDDNNKDYSEKVWGGSDIWTIGNLIAGAGVLGSEFYNKVVNLDEGIIEVAKQYINQKINNFGSSTASDPITLALKSRFQPSLVEIPDGYAAWSTKEIVRWNAENLGYQGTTASFTYLNNGKTYKTVITYSQPVYFMPMITSDGHYTIRGICFEDNSYTFSTYVDGKLSTSLDQSVSVGSGGFALSGGINCLSTYTYLSSSSPIPFYQITDSSDINAMKKIGLGISPDQLFSPYEKNYIDTDGEYGWASTADLSPSDLAQANPALANNLLGKDVSISALVSAINALKNQLEEQNPNINIDEPLPYPDVPTYSVIVNNVISDPAIFPEKNPSGGESSGGSSPSPSPSPEGGGNGDSGNNDGKKWVVDLSKFFPFCIPFDLIHLISALDAEPVAPCWEIPLQLPAYGIDYTFTIDLSSFNDVAKVFRTCETILFVLSLILITRKLIRG